MVLAEVAVLAVLCLLPCFVLISCTGEEKRGGMMFLSIQREKNLRGDIRRKMLIIKLKVTPYLPVTPA